MTVQDPYYSLGRVAHIVGHWHCDVAIDHSPGDCMQHWYREPGTQYRVSPDIEIFAIAHIRADIERAYGALSRRHQHLVTGMMDLGPRDRTEHQRDWRSRRLDFWHANRGRYHCQSLSAEHCDAMARAAIRRMTRFLATGRTD